MTSGAPRPLRLLVVAAAGYGKTTALESALPRGGRRLSGRAALTAELSDAPAYGLDDLDRLSPAEQVVLARRLDDLPPDVGLVLASRQPLEHPARSRLRGSFLERGPRELLLPPHAVARVLAEDHGLPDPGAAELVHDLTAGWPALVALAADELRRDMHGDLRSQLGRPGSPTATWLTSNVLSGLPEDLVRVLAVVAELGPVTTPVLDTVAHALGLSPVAGAGDLLQHLGVTVDRPRLGRGEHRVVVPALAAVVGAGGAVGSSSAALLAAAATYEADDVPLAAARAYARAGRRSEVHRVVATYGETMLRQGDAAGLVELLSDEEYARDDLVRRTYADALRLAGEPAAALRAFVPLMEVADECGWSVELATRVAAVHHTLGDYGATLETLMRADGSASEVERVEWLAFRVRALVMLGRRMEAEGLAAHALAAAERLGTPRALAAAHLATARVSHGARKDAHHEQARLAAEEDGDAVTAALVMVNQAYLELASARFADAAVTGREVVRISATCCPPGRRVAALHNLAEALTRLGEFDEATWHLQRSVALARHLGPGGTAVGLLGLADIHQQRGHDEQANAAYLEAVSLARVSQENQVLVPALAGLARLQVRTAPDEALATAREAELIASESSRPFALIALGKVLASRGDRATASEAASEAVALSRHQHAFDLLAEALELAAECAATRDEAVDLLREALGIWRSGGAAPATARIEVLLAAMPGADATVRAQGRDAERRLAALGLDVADDGSVVSRWVVRTVEVRVLGGFEVAVDGDPVPLVAWRSRQARTLVKILAGRRGRPLTRGHLCELLWPDDDPGRTGHRLSVLLATVRGVLDPGKSRPADRYVASDQSGIWLDLRHVRVDADELIRDAHHAAALVADGEDERAAAVFADVDVRYVGEAFEDDPYEEWADGLREEARAAWAAAVRQLVTIRNRAGRTAESHRLLVRLLATDPYDEQAHRLLVRLLTRTGRHGEARRAFDRWTEAMRLIDAPLPDRDVLHRRDRRVPRGAGGLVVTS